MFVNFENKGKQKCSNREDEWLIITPIRELNANASPSTYINYFKQTTNGNITINV